MTWNAVAALGAQVRPFSGTLPPQGGRRAQFTAPMRRTTLLLARELEHLDGRRIVVELGIRERDLRLDGFPRADARAPEHPCVAVNLESRYGPLRYATGEFTHWEDNLRAIALALEALRAVDRYGVSKRGEQYAGWKALPMSTDAADSLVTREQAVEFLGRWRGGPDWSLRDVVRRAVKETHPDREGGDADLFRRVMKAKELVGA